MRHLLKLATIFLRCIPAFFRGRRKQAIVELALRHQLATFALKGRRPRVSPTDRAFWVFLSRTWSGWEEILVIVPSDTIVPAVRFRLFYAWFVIVGLSRVGVLGSFTSSHHRYERREAG